MIGSVERERERTVGFVVIYDRCGSYAQVCVFSL